LGNETDSTGVIPPILLKAAVVSHRNTSQAKNVSSCE